MSLTDTLRSLLKTKPSGVPDAPASGVAPALPARTLEVTVERGYRPGRLTARAGEPVRVTFLRNETSACSKEVVFPGLGIRRSLPAGEKVSVDLPPLPPGVVPFTCGMGMLKGGIEVL